MRTLDFLARLHETLAPPTYLEIGVRYGDSLIHSRSAAIGIDPVLRLRHPVPDGAVLFEETSDAYFERRRPLEPFDGRPASLALIDGMHLSEYSLRDFINVERHSDWTSVVVFDDILPRSVEEASRERTTTGWTGDVFKIVEVLSTYRPDLIQLRVGTKPTGVLLVLGLDPDSRALSERYDELASGFEAPDPQAVPADLLKRVGLIDPETLLSASFWTVLRDARAEGAARTGGVDELRAAIERDGLALTPPAGGGSRRANGPRRATRLARRIWSR